MRKYILTLILLAPFFVALSQTWKLELSSTVELRKVKLTNSILKDDRSLAGAIIVLMQGSTVISQTRSTPDGDFTVEIPANGQFELIVSYEGCNPKKFSISTTDVPPEIGTGKFKPSFNIGGVIMAKALFSIDYSVLKQPMVKIKWLPDKKRFDHDEKYTDQVLDALGRLRKSEDELLEKFITDVKAADVALKKNDCPLAKTLYERSLKTIPDEIYPKEQLIKVGACLKEKDAEAKKTADDIATRSAAEKAVIDKARADKAIADKLLTDKATKEKEAQVVKEKAAAGKADADKAAADKAASDKALADVASKEKADKEKSETDKNLSAKASKEKAEAERLAQEKDEKEAADAKVITDKKEAELAARIKAANDKTTKEEADKLVKEKAEQQKSEKDKKDSERLVKEKAASDKSANDVTSRLAKEKAAKENLEKQNTKEPVVVKEQGSKIIRKESDEPSKTKGKKSKGDSKFSIRQKL